MKIHLIMVKLLYAYRQLQLALFCRLPNKSKSNTKGHFQHLPVKEPHSYKTIPYCSLTRGLTLLSTNNFPTYYIALLFYLKNIGCHFPLDCLSVQGTPHLSPRQNSSRKWQMIVFRDYMDPVFEKQYIYYDHSLLRSAALYNGIQINLLAPELFFLILAHLYIKCE